MGRLRVLGVAAALLLAACTEGERPAPAPAPTEAGLGWKRLRPAPSERTEVAAAAVGDRIYLLGGFAPDGATVATVEVYDTAADAWSRGPDLPEAVNHAMAATLDGVLYVAGGHGQAGPSRRLARLEGERWRTLALLPEGRAAGGLVAAAGRLYLVGGVAPGGLAAATLVYDPAADRWSSAPGLPRPREHLGAAATGGRVYVVGGRVGGLAGNLADADVFDPASGRWSALPAMPTARGGLAAAATGDGMVVAVGGEAEATFPEAEAFDVRAGRWRSLPPLPTPRHGLGVVAVGRVVYVLAGGPRPGLHASAANEAIDLTRLGASRPPLRGCHLCVVLGRPNILAMFVCHCRALTDGEIREAIAAGACDLDEVGRSCGAGINCGGCCPMIQELLAQHAPAAPAPLLATTSS